MSNTKRTVTHPSAVSTTKCTVTHPSAVSTTKWTVTHPSAVSTTKWTVTHPSAVSTTMARGLSRLELMTVLVTKVDMVIMTIWSLPASV